MQKKAATVKRSPGYFSGFAAVMAGFLYSFRWLWELWEGTLKNMNYPPSLVTQFFFLLKILMIMTLLGVYRQAKPHKAAQYGLLASCVGLAWTSITRTAEAYGASGPWGLYSSPGLLMFFAGLLTAAVVLMRSELNAPLGKALSVIGMFSFLGSLSSVLLFNILGRDLEANHTASAIANLFLVAEGIGWVYLGVKLWKAPIPATLYGHQLG
ncbi:hypothetical protein [Pontibacter cellulosilyticus]|uniref:Uncharacterized protein n=1 Tax=Pontibacter cellulosilyticus TaxID=1720253 RepID=A0A923N3L1_9BACT|nr:hypothetical protein [Pontibacter cellulosilyticus]MBC5991858.1 hypothetical protein [Pontibacter cellulosilyticus]